MSIETDDDGDGDGADRRVRRGGARRPRRAAGRGEVPRADQVRHARLEHPARRPRRRLALDPPAPADGACPSGAASASARPESAVWRPGIGSARGSGALTSATVPAWRRHEVGRRDARTRRASVAGGGPHLVVVEQVGIDEHRQTRGVAERRRARRSGSPSPRARRRRRPASTSPRRRRRPACARRAGCARSRRRAPRPSTAKIRDFTIWPTSTPIAAAASAAVLVPSGKWNVSMSSRRSRAGRRPARRWGASGPGDAQSA